MPVEPPLLMSVKDECDNSGIDFIFMTVVLAMLAVRRPGCMQYFMTIALSNNLTRLAVMER